MSFPRSTLATALLNLALAGSVNAQAALGAPTCYRFDRYYFGWVGRPPAGRQWPLVDSSRVIQLDSAAHAPPAGFSPNSNARAVHIPSMHADARTMERWLGFSSWQPIGGDSVELHWRNGLSGPVFRLAVRKDSLVGRVRFTTDVVGAEPPPETARAVRVPCG